MSKLQKLKERALQNPEVQCEYDVLAEEYELIPNEVVGMVIEQNMTPMRAWREYLKLTQAEVAKRLNITQVAYAQLEASQRPRKPTLQRVSAALGITVEQQAI
ncbi:Helix-turn-helix [Microbulbifer donghaiensis]|uniref:Helix-turn-helix n=1 Tax=Microbulbifer donghaiensis TaxID=494016 RepID=A0A1M4XP48_9GAMM|nr:helix-turn-helix transcriptional regulator [Microbulbifer donghaiensis]SHE95218.1 Helix-turn-helix [Microbulbifer donghaiensis]